MMLSTGDHWVPTNHGRLFARVWAPDNGADGAAGAILLFHDSLGSVELWRDFPLALAEATGRTVVAYDRLGFGRSDAHPGRLDASFTRAEAETSVPALCAALGIAAMIPFGHSVGGAMAVATAARWPARCRAVVTEAAQAFVEDRTAAAIRDARTAFAAPGQVERLERYHGAKARWVLDAWIETWLGPDFADWTIDEELRRLACPLLAIHGDRDEYGSAVHPRRITDRAGGPSAMLILEDCGHVPHREKAPQVLAAVAQFLGAPPPRS